ncbi:MAG: hypothetical protein M3O30_06570 [Planctomycetota bacterium]|nr:hypothetical protein [Planctomycetota bacterium]
MISTRPEGSVLTQTRMTGDCHPDALRPDRARVGLELRATAALVITAGVVITIYFCLSMSGGMLMPGGWTMSMVWMRMPGRSWPCAAASFMLIWVVMMLPSLASILMGYRRSISGPSERFGSPAAKTLGTYLF